MFLLIPRQLDLMQSHFPIYIPLCFYLYFRFLPMVVLYMPNLHSTMFLLIRSQVMRTVKRSNIYIPLCFYLYRDRKRGLIMAYVFTFHYVSTYTQMRAPIHSPSLNLHSTMFLLIRKEYKKRGSPLFIYIPLCFYLYEFQTVFALPV